MLLLFLALGNKQGDVYYVESESAGYVWIDDNGTLRWELLGMTVDTSNFLTKSGLLQTSGTSTNNTMSQNAITTSLVNKQDTLVSGTNIKTINNESILGSGNIEIQGGSSLEMVLSPNEHIVGYDEYDNKNIYEKSFRVNLTRNATDSINLGFILTELVDIRGSIITTQGGTRINTMINCSGPDFFSAFMFGNDMKTLYYTSSWTGTGTIHLYYKK